MRDVHIVLVQELAGITLFAQASQPVLAHEVVVRVRELVLIWAVVAQGAVALAVSFAYWPVGGETEAVFLFEEAEEGKVCVGRGEGEISDLAGDGSGGGRGWFDGGGHFEYRLGTRVRPKVVRRAERHV